MTGEGSEMQKSAPEAKKAAEFAQRPSTCTVPVTPDQRTPGEKMTLSNVRFNVLLVKFFISPPG